MLAVLVTGTLIFGLWGNWRYEVAPDGGRAPNVFSVIYHSCQFLIAHGAHLEGHVPWQLQLGRFLGVAALFTAGMIAFTKFFYNEALLCCLHWPWRRNHVVVCGLGDLGLRLALDARQRRRFVVAIEKHGDSAALERARLAGVLVMEGDACDAAMLRKVRLDRADFLVAACPDDSTNVAIAALTGRIVADMPHRPNPLVCRLLLHEPKIRQLLANHAVFGPRIAPHSTSPSSANYRVNIGDLNLEETAARQALRQHQLDFQPIRQDDKTTVHLVVVGFGSIGQHPALQAARIGHFANGVTQDRKLRITVIDEDAREALIAFCTHFPKLGLICELQEKVLNPRAAGSLDALCSISNEAEQRQELVTYAICLSNGLVADDSENLRIGVELAARTMGKPVQTLLYQSSRCGFAALFPAESGGIELSPRLHAFGMIEDIYSWDLLLHESEDRIARAIHEVYASKRQAEGGVVDSWDMLADAFKESNRHAADHIPVKLRALGYHDAPLQPSRPRIEQFTESEILLLAQMEHRRWCAERWLANWEHGPETIRQKKISKDLIDWPLLEPAEYRKDYEQISAIPEVLARDGRGVYR